MHAKAEGREQPVFREALADWDDGHDHRQLRMQLSKEGFASIRGITDADDVRCIRAEIPGILNDEDVLQTGCLRNLGDAVADLREAKILEILSPSARRPRLLESCFFRRALEVSRQILGSTACLRFDHFVTKPPRGEQATEWHQDGAYARLTRSPRRLHWWLPLQYVDMANG